MEEGVWECGLSEILWNSQKRWECKNACMTELVSVFTDVGWGNFGKRTKCENVGLFKLEFLMVSDRRGHLVTKSEVDSTSNIQSKNDCKIGFWLVSRSQLPLLNQMCSEPEICSDRLCTMLQLNPCFCDKTVWKACAPSLFNISEWGQTEVEKSTVQPTSG